MARRFASAILSRLVFVLRLVLRLVLPMAAIASLGGGCGSDAPQSSDAAVSRDADFSVCQDTPAVTYMPGITVMSTSGAYVVTLTSAVTDGTPPIVGPQVGLNTWVVSVTNAADATPAAVPITAERPWMPLHNHGATTFPVATPGDAGKFTVSEIDFFMAGYWQQTLDLQPSSAAVDKASFAICVPQ